jgi:hypothetical protein
LPKIDAEIQSVVEAIEQIRNDTSSTNWTVAIVLSAQSQEKGQRKLIELFKSCGIQARWASGEDVKESVDHVIVTDYESIVGLEFDCVCTMGVDQLLASGKAEFIQALWVAITRPRKFLIITRTGHDRIFDNPKFAGYQKSV